MASDPTPRRALYGALAAALPAGLSTAGLIFEDTVNGPWIARAFALLCLALAILAGAGFAAVGLGLNLGGIDRFGRRIRHWASALWARARRKKVGPTADRSPSDKWRDFSRPVVVLLLALLAGAGAIGDEAFNDPPESSRSAAGSKHPESPKELSIAWTVPDRLHESDPEMTMAQLAAETYPVDFQLGDSRDPTCAGRYEWSAKTGTSGDAHISFEHVAGCQFRAVFAREGEYDMTVLAVTSEATTSAHVTVQDWLVVSLGTRLPPERGTRSRTIVGAITSGATGPTSLVPVWPH